MGSMVFRDPQALSSILAVLRMLQPRAFVSLNTIESLVSLSNYYIVDREVYYRSLEGVVGQLTV